MKQDVCGSCHLVHPDGMNCQEAKDEHIRLFLAQQSVRRAQRTAAQAKWRQKGKHV